MFKGLRWKINNEIENRSFVDPPNEVWSLSVRRPYCYATAWNNSVLFLCPNFVKNPTHTSFKGNQVVLLIKCIW